MKTKTKSIIVLAIITLLCGLILTNVSKAASNIVGKVSVSSASGTVGSNVTVTIKAAQDISVSSEGILLKFDKTKLEYVSAVTPNYGNGEAIIVANNRDDGYIYSVTAFTQDGSEITIPSGTTFATITFKILDAAATGTKNAQGLYEETLILMDEVNNEEIATSKVTVSVPATNVTLDQTTLNLNKGGTANLTATLTPTNTTDSVVWSSNKTGVATVSNGTVTAVGNGTATITAQAGSKKATCTVNVKTPLTGITVTPTSKEILKGQEVTLKIANQPSDASDVPAATWETSDATIATVSNGVVKGIKAGTATITAKVGTYTATSAITVKEIPLQSIALNRSNFELFLGDSAVLNVLANPENTTDDIKNIAWTSSDAETVKVENGRVTALKIGKATITAKIGGKEASVEVTVPEVLIKGIKLVADDTKIPFGKTTLVYVETNPERVTENMNVKFTSSDESILVVDQDTGIVTGLKAGKATIKVSVNDKFTDEVEIEVLEKKANVKEENGKENKAEKEENGKTPEVPQLGDIAIEVFATLMVVSALGITFIVVKRNKKNNK